MSEYRRSIGGDGRRNMTENEGREMNREANHKRPAGREGAVPPHRARPVADSDDGESMNPRLFWG